MAKPKTSENMRIWEVLGKTDPAHTKQFTRAGGFKGTAVKPMWANKQMTELFGPCGLGWGQTEPQFQVVPALDEILVYCTVGLWYKHPHADDSNVLVRSETVYGVGGDKVVVKQTSGLRTDDEAFKKAYTDALSNAMKFIGVAADVHMGMFDDNKYVRQVAEEFEEEKKKEVFAEVEKQKQHAAKTVSYPTVDASEAVTSDIGLPPELDWSYNKSSGVLICRIVSAQTKTQKSSNKEYTVMYLNRPVGKSELVYYWHATHRKDLERAVGKVVKLIVIEKEKGVTVDEVLEIDGVKMEEPKEDLETQARLLASVIGLGEEELREIYSTIGKASWSVVLEMLRQRKSEMDEGVEAGAR